MPHSEGTSRYDDYGGATAKIKGKGFRTEDNTVPPHKTQAISWEAAKR